MTGTPHSQKPGPPCLTVLHTPYSSPHSQPHVQQHPHSLRTHCHTHTLAPDPCIPLLPPPLQVRTYILKNPALFTDEALKAIEEVIEKIARNACYGQPELQHMQQ